MRQHRVEEQVAVILHGPPVTGKSTLSQELQKRFPGLCRHVSLDEGWTGEHPFRFRLEERYQDLQVAREPILIVEVGCGEPPNLDFNGATRGAREWIEVLTAAERRIIPFLLMLDWNDVVPRLETRHRGDASLLFCVWQFVGLYTLFQQRHPLATFDARLGLKEHQINTSQLNIAQAADEILRVLQLA